MIKENTLTVKTISTNILRHVNNYIIEKHGSKEKNVIKMVFKVVLKIKWNMTSEEIVFLN